MTLIYVLSALIAALLLVYLFFVSAASGMACLVALMRGFVRRQTSSLGNFWVDLTRSTLYILLPLSIILGLLLVSQGVVQTFGSYASVPLLQPTADADGAAVAEQTIALGPAASQIAIKQLGTNSALWATVTTAASNGAVNSMHDSYTPLGGLVPMVLDCGHDFNDLRVDYEPAAARVQPSAVRVLVGLQQQR